jgi:hypothetical protein
LIPRGGEVEEETAAMNAKWHKSFSLSLSPSRKTRNNERKFVSLQSL